MRVVAISTIHEAIYNKNGLDFQKLFELRRELGDECLKEYKDADHIPNRELYFLPVDILVPGARPWVLNENNAHKVQAKIISSGANIPITAEAEKIFFESGVLVVPDFISNAGGITGAWALRVGGDADQAFKAVENMIGRLSAEILLEAREKKVNPQTVALNRCKQYVIKTRKQEKKFSIQETEQKIREYLGIK